MPREIRAASFGCFADVQMWLAANAAVLPPGAATAGVIATAPALARIMIATDVVTAVRRIRSIACPRSRYYIDAPDGLRVVWPPELFSRGGGAGLQTSRPARLTGKLRRAMSKSGRTHSWHN
jgi:hypothetical protein